MWIQVQTNEHIPKHKDKHYELAVWKWEMWESAYQKTPLPKHVDSWKETVHKNIDGGKELKDIYSGKDEISDVVEKKYLGDTT